MDIPNSIKIPSKTNGNGSNFTISREVGGNHYKRLKIQPIVYIMANKLDPIDANIVKYATRKKAGETNKERYDKIIQYANFGKELK